MNYECEVTTYLLHRSGQISICLENVTEEFMWASPDFKNATGNAKYVELHVELGRRVCTDSNPLYTHTHWHLPGPGPGCEPLNYL